MMYKNISDNFKQITENIQKAKEKSGREDQVRIMAVTKTINAERINAAISCGVDLLGENRVQEFLQKIPEYSDCEIHFIGGLQTNKVKQIITQNRKINMIHSVDRVKLAQEINKQVSLRGDLMDILIEVNIGGEESKNGVIPEAVFELAKQIDEEFPFLRLRGLMTIPPVVGESVKHFKKMQRLFEDLKAEVSTADTLSMGMSGDYAVAVEYGATIIRVGTALFGNRI